MSRLDQHVDAVRTRFLVQKLWDYSALTIICAVAALLLLTVVARMFLIGIPPKLLLIGGAALLAGGIALLLAIVNSPSREASAVKIDEVLGLKERFSTALASRNEKDAFAQAAVRDAEATASSVSIHKRFPYHFPRLGFVAIAAVLAFVLVDGVRLRLDPPGAQATLLTPSRTSSKPCSSSPLSMSHIRSMERSVGPGMVSWRALSHGRPPARTYRPSGETAMLIWVG